MVFFPHVRETIIPGLLKNEVNVTFQECRIGGIYFVERMLQNALFMFEILFPYNGKEYTIVFRKIIHSDGIIMYFGTLRNDTSAFINCIQIDKHRPFITLAENVCPAMQNAILESMHLVEADNNTLMLSS